MADFRDQEAGDLNSSVSPKSIPQGPSTGVALGVGRGLSNAFDALGDLFENQAKVNSGKVLANYAEEARKIFLGYDQGASRTKTLNQFGALTTRYMSEHPTAQKDIQAASNALMQNSAFGGHVTDKTPEEKLQEQEDAAMVKTFGFAPNTKITDDMRLEWANFRRAQAKAEQEKKITEQKKAAVDYESSLLTLGEKQRKAEEEQQVMKAKTNLAEMQESYFNSTNLVLLQLRADVKAGNKDPVEAIQEARRMQEQFNQSTSDSAALLDEGFRTAYLNPVEQLFTNFEEEVSGKLEAGVFEKKVEALQSRNMLRALKLDSEFAALSTLSKAWGNLPASLLGKANLNFVEMLKKLQRGYDEKAVPINPFDSDQSKAIKGNYDLTRYWMKQSQEGTVTPEKNGMTPEEFSAMTDNHVYNILKGVNAFRDTVDNPKQLKDTTDFLLSKEFKQWVLRKKQEGGIPPGLIENTETVFEELYTNQVLPMILSAKEDIEVAPTYPGAKREPYDPNTLGQVLPPKAKMKFDDVFQFQMSGDSVIIRTRPGVHADRGIMVEKKKLEEGMLGVLNTAIHLQSNLEGVEPSTLWEKIWAPMLDPDAKAKLEAEKEKKAESSQKPTEASGGTTTLEKGITPAAPQTATTDEPQGNELAFTAVTPDMDPKEANLLFHHRDQLAQDTQLNNPDGTVTTVDIIGVTGPDGKIYNIPSYWNGTDYGPLIAEDPSKAKELYEIIQEHGGLENYPSYTTAEEANAAAAKLHTQIEQDMQVWEDFNQKNKDSSRLPSDKESKLDDRIMNTAEANATPAANKVAAEVRPASPEQMTLIKKDMEAVKDMTVAHNKIAKTGALKVAAKEVVPAAHMLDLIGGGEANGDYNNYYDRSRSTFGKVDLTTKTIDQVIKFQTDMVEDQKQRGERDKSTAVGKYQFTKASLQNVKKRAGLTGREKFSPEMQDMLAILLMKKRKLNKYLKGEIDRDEFAENLAKEWAALPVLKPTIRRGKPVAAGMSYYTGVGGNHARIDLDLFNEVLDEMKMRFDIYQREMDPDHQKR